MFPNPMCTSTLWMHLHSSCCQKTWWERCILTTSVSLSQTLWLWGQGTGYGGWGFLHNLLRELRLSQKSLRELDYQQLQLWVQQCPGTRDPWGFSRKGEGKYPSFLILIQLQKQMPENTPVSYSASYKILPLLHSSHLSLLLRLILN